MNAKQGDYAATENVNVEQEHLVSTLEQISQASTEDSATLAQIMETNASLNKKIKE